MDVKFDFEFEGKSYFGNVYRPVAKVSLKSFKKDLWVNIWMVVDTGADFTILPRYLSGDLGISLEKDCVADVTKGVGGQQTIHLVKSKLEAQVGDLKREIPLAFFSSDELPPLMGRLGFLETFDVEFLKEHIVVFKN
ncbi:hypothetical protein A2630_03790 [Candidatus Woesebacteria bacterium RIFCSPHIGHO2_01_FULL_44_10]|uniref:Peptidase A2 domain-containing protein n=1 Tax=Candidatus Woesebacteria bacterium RIFCSPLOWO2_01_FULL_44_14 TaxID=1802525 RepID=A0A1F8C577_9BACT|nr:MAG: hypothetical protein A2630_03790 [Candidatus Woesebacteria bacterium RIFCSPHIGHO2_01_FULL_44_10]OGM55625.1 MAG: hypothetical protein A3F62_02330 [Candidatus Woesebacteria bacterium RIFCSPHIGHO2_12_FULL_44_11]OGM70898.1 MAG: hypothetical protein A2975_01320 [Candidatus Woesebacteria bacterium RIFCSPLOWO2_01_FULL_44_14]